MPHPIETMLIRFFQSAHVILVPLSVLAAAAVPALWWPVGSRRRRIAGRIAISVSLAAVGVLALSILVGAIFHKADPNEVDAMRRLPARLYFPLVLASLFYLPSAITLLAAGQRLLGRPGRLPVMALLVGLILCLPSALPALVQWIASKNWIGAVWMLTVHVAGWVLTLKSLADPATRTA
jgi:hypothetical protein